MADRKPLFDLEGFYQALSATRESRDLTWKDVADQTSLSASTLTRMAQNRRPDADGLAALSAWSGLNPADFVLYGNRVETAEPLAEISKVLRRDPQLDADDATALEDIVRTAYERMVRKRPSTDRK